MVQNPGTPNRMVERQAEADVHIGVTIVQALSEATGVPIEEMDAELNDFVDPDALDRLFAPRIDGEPRSGGRVAFSMLDCTVRVFSDGRVVVENER